MTPEEFARWGSIGAYKSWANTVDRAGRTANARKKMLDRFEHQVDPNGVLSPGERAKRAEFARRAYFRELAMKSAKIRRLRAGGEAQ
jgi:hypothetical protein